MSEATVANCAPPLRWICDPARRAPLISGPYWGNFSPREDDEVEDGNAEITVICRSQTHGRRWICGIRFADFVRSARGGQSFCNCSCSTGKCLRFANASARGMEFESPLLHREVGVS